MDKLKTKVLFVALIILALVSVSAVAAADVDDVVSAEQDDIDLSEEAVSNVQSAQETDVLTADEPTATILVDYRNTSGVKQAKQVQTTSPGVSSTIGVKKLESMTGVKPTNPSAYNFTYQNVRYVFNHWEEVVPDGENIILDADYRKTIGYTGESYEVHYIAVYDEILPGNLTVNNIDPIAHGNHSWSCSADNVNYTHTYINPADIPDSVVFLYWEREDTGEKFKEGDNLTVTVDEYKDKTLVINVYAVYDIKTSIELEEITGYVGDKVDITATITEDLTNKAVPGGTATLTIDYENKLSDGSLGASTYTDTVEVDADGKAVFKDVKLENPGTYKYTVTYSRYNYNHHDEGINDYLSSEADSKLNILPLNTTTTSEDVSGTVGDKKDITADIVDQNGDPVQNGTAVLKVNGKEYKAEVKDGKAVFKGVELTENTTATIEYLGNEYYNPSNTTIEITVTVPEEPVDEPVDEPEEEPSTPAVEKSVPVTPAAGNPIALVVLALLSLVSTVSFGRKK
ncbi:Ig-like domain-containing protein [Methanosphaera sp.]|uniref:Ig-like domain-containing protein n=1 Tax=Methanosphaera sp. TaxID=2666342 RepID=UPI0025DF2B9E|nr:Ig-like domain-containing protein [Methanosphaera sp.]